MTTLSEAIASFRKEKNEPQTALADALGVSNRTVSKWENGESEPDAAALAALADHYSTSVDALLGRAPKVPDPYENAETYTDAALIYSRENKKTLDRLEEAYHRIFHKHFNSDEVSHESQSKPAAPPFPWSEDGTPWEDNAYSHVKTSCLFAQLCAGREVNMSVALFPNEANYAWLADRSEEIAAALRAFGDARFLRLLVKMHAPDFPEKFTLEYAAEEAGMPAAELEPALDLLFPDGTNEIELEEGNAKLYGYWNGDPRLLAALSLFYLNFVARETGTNLHNGSFRPLIRKEEQA
ncbi:MAG: helix-turn-helix domain-containing protein [Clostridia bacterium]|nr:helix-turn-helix domain-containing protein [Clostridia bacterium]